MSQSARSSNPRVTTDPARGRTGPSDGRRDRSLLETGRETIRHEATALLRLADQLDTPFCAAIDYLANCAGSVIVSGMGKAGLVGQKIAATLASTGTRSHFLHPAEAIHGDLGRVHADDVILLLSHSGETEEVVRLLPSLASLGSPIVAITGRPQSQLGRQATVTLWIGDVSEVGPLKLAPTTSTTAMLALGDALAMALSERRGFTPMDFARFHPGGSLGRKLARVEEWMRPRSECRVATDDQSVRTILTTLSRPGRRSGAVMLTNAAGELSGIFTDSDLARILERQADHLLDSPIRSVMTESPICVQQGLLMTEAVDILTERRISELPVVDPRKTPVGMLDITDVVAFLPHDPEEAPGTPQAPQESPRLRIHPPSNPTD